MLRTSFIKCIAVSASVLSSLGLLLSMPQPARAQGVQMEEDIPATVEENSPVMSGDGVTSDETIEVEEDIPATVEERSPVMTGGSSQPSVTQPAPNANSGTTNSPRALW